MSTEEAVIDIQKVSKYFSVPHQRKTSLKEYFLSPFSVTRKRKFRSLSEVSFSVKKGEVLGIIGRNGSGKSTLLKIMAGIYHPSSGKVEIKGKVVPFLELGVGFNLELSGRENIFLNGTILGMSRKFLKENFDKIIDFAELREFIDLPLKNYSSGMQVRLAFSIAILADADIYLMDEVLAVGDSNFQSRCLEIFNNYKNAGKTIILVTHDIGVVERYCNRAVLLRKGYVESIGDADSVVNAYINQNMEDEEKRLTDESEGDTFSKESKLTTKPRITGVVFLDSQGHKKNVFKTWEDLSVRVHFNAGGKLEGKLNFGLALYNIEEDNVFSINTFGDQIDTRFLGEKGYFQVDFESIPLKTNSYYIKAGIWGDNVTKLYNFYERSNIFKIVGKTSTTGIVEIKHNWVKK